MKALLTGALALLFLTSCYDPKPFEAESISASSSKSDIGTVFPQNGGSPNQICNPSVSMDTVNYPGAMLWLNFSGTLDVKSKEKVFATEAKQHDRLTVTDTSNKVLWYVMIDTAAGDCQFQDPEWSTHPDYIVALRAYDLKGSRGCRNTDYGIFAIRTSDKKKFWFYDKNIIEEATPHVWVDPSAERDSDADDSTVEGFFGTKNVRLTYVTDDAEIVFVDYAAKGKEVKLKKPSDRTSWSIDSPLISPDGKFVVYNMTSGSTTWEAYIQELSANSTPVKIEREEGMMSDPAQPHWFAYNGKLFVLWAEFPKDHQMLNKDDLADQKAQDGSIGRTAMREVKLTAGAPKDLAVEWIGNVREVATVPMTGGRSPDGKFLATGTNYGYVLELP